MKERPIIFAGESVRAILEGKKTRTTRVVRPQPKGRIRYYKQHSFYDFATKHIYRCPHGVVGDRLWVREAYQIQYAKLSRAISGIYINPLEKFDVRLTEMEWKKFKRRKRKGGNQSPRFMYKSLARLRLEITGIRVERLQDISISDLRQEGMQFVTANQGFLQFRNLWDLLNAKRGYEYEKNPVVWAIDFKRIRRRI